LRRRLHCAIALLWLPRLVVVAVAMVGVAGVMIVRMVVRCRERRLFKEMMDAMRGRSRKKKNK
jgi:hypothetical protein